jgi:peptide/nickel transport system substrate-binding protein
VGRRRLAALTCAAVLGAWLAAASPAPASGAPLTLSVVIPGPFNGCDPGSAGTSASTDAVLSLVLPSAFTPGALGTPVGDTEVISEAEVVSLDPQVVVYTIAPGTTWPDGTPFSASDLVRAWQERRDDQVVADLGYRDVAYVHPGPDGTTATVGFTTPYADWESLFNLVVPTATATAQCSAPSALLDPSLGPYEIVRATTSRIELTANPAWTGAAPGFARVVVTDGSPWAATKFGAARVVDVPSPSPETLEAVTSVGDYTSRLEPSTTVVSLDFAVGGPHALTPEARRGLASLVDRSALVDQFAAPVDDTASPAVSHLFGEGDPDYSGPLGGPVSHPVAPAPPAPGAAGSAAYGGGPDAFVATTDLLAAGDVKSASGWFDASHQPLQVCLAAPDDDVALADLGRSLADQLTSRGVAVDVRVVPSVAAVVAFLRGGACATGIVERTGDGFVTHSAASWLAPTGPVPAGLEWTGVDDAVLATDAQGASSVLNPIDAAATWDAMDNRLWTLMASLPLYSPSSYVGWSLSVAGVLPCNTTQGLVSQIPALLPVSSHT